MPLRSSDVNLGQYFIRRNLLPVRELANQREREVRITQQPFWQLGDLCPHLPPWCSIIFPHPTFSPVSPPPTRHTFSHFPPPPPRTAFHPGLYRELSVSDSSKCVSGERASVEEEKPLGFDVSTLVRVSFSKAAELLRWEFDKFRRFFRKQNSPHLL